MKLVTNKEEFLEAIEEADEGDSLIFYDSELEEKLKERKKISSGTWRDEERWLKQFHKLLAVHRHIGIDHKYIIKEILRYTNIEEFFRCIGLYLSGELAETIVGDDKE